MRDGDTGGAEHVRAANAGQFEQMRRLHGASRQDNLPTRGDDTLRPASAHECARATPALQRQAQDVGVGPNGQVRSLEDWLEVGVGGAPAPAPMLVDLVVAETVLAAPL